MSDAEFDEDVSFSEIRTRMGTLSERDRGRALRRLSALYPVDPPLQGAGSSASTQDSNTTTVVIDRSTEQKLPRFSGHTKLGQGEVNFQKWHRAAKRLLDDSTVADNAKRNIIFRSLIGLAEDIADYHREKSPKEIVDLVQVQFGGLQDGEDMLIEFHQHVQQVNESAAEYLSALFIELGEVLNNGGINSVDMPKILLKQFIRGTSDEDILTKLRLEDRLSNPPTFPEFIRIVRTEESRRTEKRLRMKKMARSHQVSATEDGEVQQLRQELAEMKARLDSTAAVQETLVQAQRAVQPEQRVSRNIFCYRCGEDNHVAYDCVNTPNRNWWKRKVKRENK